MSVAVLINVRARHGSEALGQQVRTILPEARIAITRSLEEARAWVREDLCRDRPEILLSGGGDGTAVALLNELRDHDLRVPAFGLLPLGTGNGWARATGGVGKREALRGLSALRDSGPPAVRKFPLVEAEGRLTPFAGAGWDSEILADYKNMNGGRLGTISGARGGYFRSLTTRTIPRALSGKPRPIVRITNLGPPALTVDEAGTAVPMAGGEEGAVLYEGPLGVGGASTTEELGLGFRAFPYAHLVPGRMAVRVYGASALSAALRVPRLWRGAPVSGDHNFFVTRCRFEFDRPVPFEIGGDLVGDRTSVELSLVDDAVPLIDWRRLGRP